MIIIQPVNHAQPIVEERGIFYDLHRSCLLYTSFAFWYEGDPEGGCIRFLTETESERLMGLPEGWTKYRTGIRSRVDEKEKRQNSDAEVEE